MSSKITKKEKGILKKHGVVLAFLFGSKVSGPVRIVVLIFASEVMGSSIDNEMVEAARLGDLKKVAARLQSGADVHARDDAALMHAAANGQTQIVRLLLEHGANPNSRNGASLYFAAKDGYLDSVKLLLEKGANVNTQWDTGATALHAAIYRNQVKVVGFLLEHGANPNVQDREGKTPLIKAVQYEAVPIVKQLLAKEANITLKDKDGKTALEYRKMYGPLDYKWESVVRSILKNGVNADGIVKMTEKKNYPEECFHPDKDFWISFDRVPQTLEEGQWFEGSLNIAAKGCPTFILEEFQDESQPKQMCYYYVIVDTPLQSRGVHPYDYDSGDRHDPCRPSSSFIRSGTYRYKYSLYHCRDMEEVFREPCDAIHHSRKDFWDLLAKKMKPIMSTNLSIKVVKKEKKKTQGRQL